jgi:hypothetical protein
MQLTKEQAIVLTIITGSVLTPMRNVLEDISKRMGRDVLAEEFKNQEFIDQVKELYWDEFLLTVNRDEPGKIIIAR